MNPLQPPRLQSLGESSAVSYTLIKILHKWLGNPQGYEHAMASREVTLELYRASKCSDEGVRELLRRAREWVREVYELASRSYPAAYVFSMETTRRLLVHVRSPQMPLEVGLAWHPVLNLPYIPASSLKGAARAAFEERSLAPCGMPPQDLYGTLRSEGYLVFTDAVPVGCRGYLVEPEIVNPHYPEHEGRVAEHLVRPRPIVYPAVAVGVTLNAVVAVADDKAANCTQLIRSIKEALERGVGARTSLGYGRLRVGAPTS